jgi:hypothetical protein
MLIPLTGAKPGDVIFEDYNEDGVMMRTIEF